MTSAPGRLRQEDYELQVSQGYTMRPVSQKSKPRTQWGAYLDPGRVFSVSFTGRLATLYHYKCRLRTPCYPGMKGRQALVASLSKC